MNGNRTPLAEEAWVRTRRKWRELHLGAAWVRPQSVRLVRASTYCLGSTPQAASWGRIAHDPLNLLDSSPMNRGAWRKRQREVWQVDVVGGSGVTPRDPEHIQIHIHTHGMDACALYVICTFVHVLTGIEFVGFEPLLSEPAPLIHFSSFSNYHPHSNFHQWRHPLPPSSRNVSLISSPENWSLLLFHTWNTPWRFWLSGYGSEMTAFKEKIIQWVCFWLGLRSTGYKSPGKFLSLTKDMVSHRSKLVHSVVCLLDSVSFTYRNSFIVGFYIYLLMAWKTAGVKTKA